MMTLIRRQILKPLVACSILLLAATIMTGRAGAATMMPGLTIDFGTESFDAMDMSTWTSSNGSLSGTINGMVDNGDGSITASGDMSMINNASMGMWDFGWMLVFDADPFVKLVIDITNTSGMTQTFGLFATSPVSPAISPSSIMDGWMDGTITDSGGDGSATLGTIPGYALYDALIDGVSQQTLAPHPNSISCSSSSGCSGGFVFPLSFGPTGGPAVGSSIGVQNVFTLTAGDTIHLESFFQVTAVPVPAAVWLFGSGLLALLGIARRKVS